MTFDTAGCVARVRHPVTSKSCAGLKTRRLMAFLWQTCYLNINCGGVTPLWQDLNSSSTKSLHCIPIRIYAYKEKIFLGRPKNWLLFWWKSIPFCQSLNIHAGCTGQKTNRKSLLLPLRGSRHLFPLLLERQRSALECLTYPECSVATVPSSSGSGCCLLVLISSWRTVAIGQFKEDMAIVWGYYSMWTIMD